MYHRYTKVYGLFEITLLLFCTAEGQKRRDVDPIWIRLIESSKEKLINNLLVAVEKKSDGVLFSKVMGEKVLHLGKRIYPNETCFDISMFLRVLFIIVRVSS